MRAARWENYLRPQLENATQPVLPKRFTKTRKFWITCNRILFPIARMDDGVAPHPTIHSHDPQRAGATFGRRGPPAGSGPRGSSAEPLPPACHLRLDHPGRGSGFWQNRHLRLRQLRRRPSGLQKPDGPARSDGAGRRQGLYHQCCQHVVSPDLHLLHARQPDLWDEALGLSPHERPSARGDRRDPLPGPAADDWRPVGQRLCCAVLCDPSLAQKR